MSNREPWGKDSEKKCSLLILQLFVGHAHMVNGLSLPKSLILGVAGRRLSTEQNVHLHSK